jgi:hypothetical protein
MKNVSKEVHNTLIGVADLKSLPNKEEPSFGWFFCYYKQKNPSLPVWTVNNHLSWGSYIRYVASPYIEERISSYEASTVDATCVM